MPIVDQNRLKGNEGVSRVASWLAPRCLVRPVAEGTDVGIDLFCETVDKTTQKPFLHFWVQVRTGKQVRVRGGEATSSFTVDHIEYWSRQPVPVYAFLVPEAPSGLDFSALYVLSFTRRFLRGDLVLHGEASKSLPSDFVIQDRPGALTLDAFVDFVIRVDHAALQIRKGVSEPLPDLGPKYIREEIRKFRGPFAGVVTDQIRRSAAMTVLDLLDQGTLTAEDERRLGVLTDVLQPYTRGIRDDAYWEQHWEDYYAVGRYLKHRGNDDGGERLMRRAIEIIHGDKKFQQENPFWDTSVAEIEGHLG